jgi:hypothetical protein
LHLEISAQTGWSNAGHPESKLPGIGEDNPKNGAVSKKLHLLENGTSRKLCVQQIT